ncbi:DUF6191 domain-containing protein [Nocardia thailandica]|uniref:DUF6191 domain-containing protein n=1 Tax=Nocardia thailandica TaxID=257275 RepID=A0ABW6PQA9_9NOCA
MDVVLGLSLPLGVLLLLAVGGYELRQRRRAALGQGGLAAAYVDEMTALLYPTKRDELEHRSSVTMLREDESTGDRPWTVDLGGGVVLRDGRERL